MVGSLNRPNLDTYNTNNQYFISNIFISLLISSLKLNSIKLLVGFLISERSAYAS